MVIFNFFLLISTKHLYNIVYITIFEMVTEKEITNSSDKPKYLLMFMDNETNNNDVLRRKINIKIFGRIASLKAVGRDCHTLRTGVLWNIPHLVLGHRQAVVLKTSEPPLYCKGIHYCTIRYDFDESLFITGREFWTRHVIENNITLDAYVLVKNRKGELTLFDRSTYKKHKRLKVRK